MPLQGSGKDGSDTLPKQKLKLLDLPNEIVLHALCTIPTLPLLYIRTVNHRFRNLVERIVHNRLVVAALLTDWKLIVECYHPSSQYSEPYVFCEYLGTPDLSSDAAWQPTMDSSQSSGPRKGLKGLLGRFRPTLKTPEIMITHSHLAGDVSGSRTMESNSSPRPSEEEPVVRRVNLDSHENFSQLMFSASLVQIGPRKGVFLALADVLERKTIRIFRDWLGRKAHAALKKEANAQHELLIEEAQEENSVGREAELVWVDESTKIAGLEIEVRELRWSRDMPILLSRDEDQALGYSLELRELRVSIVHLLLAIERKLLETDSDTGRAMIFGSFPISTTQESPNSQNLQTVG